MVISIWHCKSVGFALQKSRFYRAKPTLLECKTIGFGKYLTMPKFTSHFFVYCY